MPNEAFFHWNPELLGLGRQIGQINSGAFAEFSAKISAFPVEIYGSVRANLDGSPVVCLRDIQINALGLKITKSVWEESTFNIFSNTFSLF